MHKTFYFAFMNREQQKVSIMRQATNPKNSTKLKLWPKLELFGISNISMNSII